MTEIQGRTAKYRTLNKVFDIPRLIQCITMNNTHEGFYDQEHRTLNKVFIIPRFNVQP